MHTDGREAVAEAGDRPRAEPTGRLLPAKAVHEDFGFGRRTLGREIKDNPDFPKAIRINGRLYFCQTEIEIYKRDLIRRSVGAV
jgi:predicted DNA-binding transcriptional regulator AlpA